MRRALPLVAAVAGLLALIAVALVMTSGGGSPEPQGNLVVNREGLIDVSNSPTVANNPAREGNVVVTYRKDRPGYDALISYSFNGGESWEQSVLPLPQGITGCTASQGAPCPFAPDIAFAPDGTLYVVYVNLVGNGNRPDNLWISTSTDGGRTLALPTKIAGPLTFQQRVTVDPKGPVHVTWLQATEVGFLRFADPPPRIVTARSDDGGKTFAAPVPVSDQQRPRVLAPSPVLDKDGQLVVMYQDMKGNRRDYEYAEGPPAELPVALVLTRSTDGGRTFAPGVEIEADMLLTRRFLPFLPEIPQLAISPAGKMYATWADGRDGDDDVWLRSSSDGGRTWSPAKKVNDNAADGTAQFLPKVTVGPGERVSVIFLDGRNDPGQKQMLDAYLATSTDGGKTFENVRLSGRSFNGTEIGPTFGELYGIDFGTRLGLAHGDGTLYASWVDTSAGSPATGRQDVNFTAVDLPSGGNRATALAGVGVVVLLAAGLAVVLARRNGEESVHPNRRREQAGGFLMRLAFVGKGGAGKSAIAGTFARTLARQGDKVLAIDSDPLPGLAFSLGLAIEHSPPIPEDAVVERKEGEEGPRWRLSPDVDPAVAVEEWSVEAPDGVRFLQFGKIKSDPRALWRSQMAFRFVINKLPAGYWNVVGDLPGGTRQAFTGWGSWASTICIVVEPTAKSLLSGRRLANMANLDPDAPKRVVAVASKVRQDDDVEMIAKGTGLEVIAAIPWDEELAEAERRQLAPIDFAPDCPAVLAVESLVERLSEEKVS